MGPEQLASRSLKSREDGTGRISAEILQRLRPRERDVLVAFCVEPNAKRIAKRLALSHKTVANYLTCIQQHLRVSSQAELMRLIQTHRPLDTPPIPLRRVRRFSHTKMPGKRLTPCAWRP